MKWIAPSHHKSQRQQVLLEWHRYFAWRPVFIEGKKHDNLYVPPHFVWLEYVDRQLDDSWKDAPIIGHILIGWLAFLAPSLKWNFRPFTRTEPVWVKLSYPLPSSR